MPASTDRSPSWVAQLEQPPSKNKSSAVADPIGFSGSTGAVTKKQSKDGKVQPRKPPTAEEMETLKLKKAWEVAIAPIKGLPMTGIMMYMSGNSLQIFSIMMVFMAFKNPLVGLMNTNLAFEKFQTPNNGGQIFQTKLVYVVMQIAALALGVWKINQMGLLP